MNRYFNLAIYFAGIYLLLSLTIGQHSQSLADDENYIFWSDKKLSWDDFQGPIPENSKFDALTHSAINMDFQAEGVVMTFKIESIFDPGKSWKKEGVNDYILQHEQIHFDITEYHARLFKKKLKTTRYKSFNTIEAEVKKLFNESYDRANKMQLDYDKQTSHSINKKKQKKWNRKMSKLLKSTNSYKNPKLKVNVSYLNK